MATKTTHRLALNDQYNTQIYTKSNKTKHKSIINRYKSLIQTFKVSDQTGRGGWAIDDHFSYTPKHYNPY